jgi:hypothetical protein
VIRPPSRFGSQQTISEVPLSLDEGEAAFTEIFTKHVIPSLYDLHIHLQQRKGWAHQYLKKKSQTIGSHLDHTMILKRLTPTPSISILTTSSVPSFGHASDDPSSQSAAQSIASVNLPSRSRSSVNADPSPIAVRLEAAFWQSYPSLQQLSQNFIQHLSSSCQKKVKEKVADLIVAAWDLCEVVKRDSANSPIDQFESNLNESLSQLSLATHSEVESYLQQFISGHFQKTFLCQLEMYSLSRGVLSTVIQLTNKQQQALLNTHLNYFTAYSNKKLNEVKAVVVSRQQRDSHGQDERIRKSSQRMTSWGPDISPLVSNPESLHGDLRNFLERFFPREAIRGKTLREMFHVIDLSNPEHHSDCLSSVNEILSLLTARPCDLFLYPLNELMPPLTPSLSHHDQQLQQQQPIHSLCETICRFLIGLASVLNKYLQFYTSSPRESLHDLPLFSQICFMIVNITQFISSLQSWCQLITSATIPSPSPSLSPPSRSLSPESIGRIKIEFNKMYLEVQHSLLYYTSFLREHSLLLPLVHVTQPPLSPSTLILEAYDAKLVTIRAINRLLSSTLKSKPATNLPSFPIQESVLELIREFFHRFHPSLIEGDQAFWSRVDWSDTCAVIRKEISSEFSFLLDQLVQMCLRRETEKADE